MNSRRTLWRVVTMALFSAAGIIGMLLVESAWDWAGFALAALPLMFGGWRAYALRTASTTKTKNIPDVAQ